MTVTEETFKYFKISIAFEIQVHYNTHYVLLNISLLRLLNKTLNVITKEDIKHDSINSKHY